MKYHETLSNALQVANEKEITEVEYEVISEKKPPEGSKKDESGLTEDAEEDYRATRLTLHTLIQKGLGAVDEIRDIALAEDNPRAYEVMATMIKTLTDTSKELMELQKKTKELKQISVKKDPGSVNIDKAVFVGSAAELLDKVKEEND